MNVSVPAGIACTGLWVAAESGQEGLPITLRRGRFDGEVLARFETAATASLLEPVGIYWRTSNHLSFAQLLI